MPRLLVAMQVYLPLFSGCATWISSVPLSWITYGSPFLMLVCLSLNLNRKWKTSPRKAHQTSAPWNLCSESYHVMRGIGEPKEEQWSNAGLLAITWYTWLGGVSTRGGSAGGTRHIWKSAVSFYLALHVFKTVYWTHQEHWQKRWLSGSQTRWMHYTGRRHWSLTARCWESPCLPPLCGCGLHEHLAPETEPSCCCVHFL